MLHAVMAEHADCESGQPTRRRNRESMAFLHLRLAMEERVLQRQSCLRPVWDQPWLVDRSVPPVVVQVVQVVTEYLRQS